MDSVEHIYDDITRELDEIQGEPEEGTIDWLGLARNAYETSTDYLDSNIRQQWEASVAHQNNEHAPGSKYHTDTYKKRSRTFRPKTRTNNTNAEAAMAKAAFSTNDLASISAVNDADPAQQISAEVNQILVQHHLSKTIKWYLTLMGAYQDTRVYGVCASYQGWEYEEIDSEEPAMGPMGTPMLDERGQPVMLESKKVVKDQPVIDLMPPENVRFDPNADWRDPVNTSPYAIRLVPEYAQDVLQMAKAKGWNEYSIGEIVNAGQEGDDDTTRQQRQGEHRTDPTDARESSHKEFTLVWLHENFVRLDGVDYVYWTIGTRLQLSEPVPIAEEYPHLKHGERPIVVGYTVIEAHKNYPNSPTRLIENLQKDVNDIANQRFDNVKLALNKRYLIKRGATQIDVQSLARNVPGGAVFVGDPDRDVRVLDTPDITGSSYNDQDRLDLSIDEITGVMSQQTVQNNRNLNETVGGMSMMNKAADQAADYNIKTFIETWVEPVLRQLVRLIQYNETDETILALAANKSEQYQRFQKISNEKQIQMPSINDLLRQELTINVNIGFGATNPRTQIEQFTYALSNVANLPGAVERVNVDEVIKEIFGKVGYRDGQRFFNPPQPPQPPGPSPDKQAELQFRAEELKAEHGRTKAEMRLEMQKWSEELKAKREIEMMKLALQQNIKMDELKAKLGLEQIKDQTARDIAAGNQNLEQSKLIMQNKNMNQGFDTF